MLLVPMIRAFEASLSAEAISVRTPYMGLEEVSSLLMVWIAAISASSSAVVGGLLMDRGLTPAAAKVRSRVSRSDAIYRVIVEAVERKLHFVLSVTWLPEVAT